MFFSTSLTDMIYTHIDTDTISMYMNLLYIRGGYWVTCIFHLSGQQIKAATSSGFGPRRAWDFFVLEALDYGTPWTPLAFNLLHLWTLDVWKKTSSKYTAKFADLFVCAKDAVNCTNSREERPYEYIAGFKAWVRWLDPRCWWLSSWSGGKWADENFNVKNFKMMSPAEVETLLLQVDFWIFLDFLNFWRWKDGGTIGPIKNSETARWRANLVFGVVVGRDLRMSRRSEPLNGPMPKGQHVLW